MKSSAYHILRIGTAITFLWIGVLIIKDTQSFSALLSSWVIEFISQFTNDVDGFLKFTMMKIAIADILIGLFLLIDRFVIIASLLGFIHLAGVLMTTLLTITFRDFGLAAATLALFVHSLPSPFARPVNFKAWLKLILSR